MKRLATILAVAALGALALASPARAAGEAPCELTPRAACYGLESVDASLSVSGTQAEAGFEPTQAGAHPDLHLDFALKEDPEVDETAFGYRFPYAVTRDVLIETPPGLVGNPNVLGLPQQCPPQDAVAGTCPNGSQVGVTKVVAYNFPRLCEPVYMMVPPGGDTVARLSFVAGFFPYFINFKLRSEGDYGLTAELSESTSIESLIKAETTIWGVPADPVHDTERQTSHEALSGACSSPKPRPPGSVPLPFLTTPTRCGPAGDVAVKVDSWAFPGVFDEKRAPLGEFEGCDSLPFGPSLEVEPTSHRADSPTGADVTIKLPASEGVSVLEPAQMRSIRVKMPPGLAFNPSAGDGLGTCSEAQVHYGERVAAQCPNDSKLAFTEFDVPVLERKLKGAIYLREPQPGHPFRIWIVADDLGAHVKLKGELEVDKSSGQITEVTTEIPQAPVREAKLFFKSGFRAPLVTPRSCGTFETEYEFVPWSGGPPKSGKTPMTIDEGCDTGGFSPKLRAGTASPQAGSFSPFLFTLVREDGEQNPSSLDISMPKGLAASFSGIPRCEGAAAETGACPGASKIGHVTAAVGAGPAPLWVPQPGKRAAAVYLGGPYKGAPLSIVVVVPKQAGPFDFGDEVVRSAIYVDPETAQATIKSDPLPQLIEGIPIGYRTISVAVDRPNFTLNPTSCSPMAVSARVTSSEGAVADPSARFQAAGCASLGFKPRLALRLYGGTRRGAHPALRAVMRPRSGDANPARIVVRLPHSAFLDQAHIRTICTRVQFAAGAGHGAQCPNGAVYGHVRATTPLFDFPLEGPVFLRSSNHNLPDMVLALHGPPSLPIEIEAVGRIDSVKGGIRSSFESVPDAPLTEVVLEMQGAKKGLIVNSTDLCQGAHRATANLRAQNGRRYDFRPKVVASGCHKQRKHRRPAKRSRAARGPRR